MKALALLCVRNDEVHVESALRDLIAERLDVVLIDHDSTDFTVRRARPFLGRGLLSIERLPWEGRCSGEARLAAKRRVVARWDHDWIVDAEPDAWLLAPPPYATLHEALNAAGAAGFDAVRFAEFVFVPRPGEDPRATDYRKQRRRYYRAHTRDASAPRAWRRDAAFARRAAKPFPQEFVLRRYVAPGDERARVPDAGTRIGVLPHWSARELDASLG